MKMGSEVIISSENVKPSSPTPQNLHSYKISMFDQLVSPSLVPFVLFYTNNKRAEVGDVEVFISETTEKLKQSLSVILTRYYPLAGRVAGDGYSVDCNDEGVPFVVAKFDQNLSDVLRSNPDQKMLRRFLPCEIKWGSEYGSDSSVMLIKVCYFDCGGIAIGVLFWHKVGDAVTIANILNSWAAMNQGLKQPVCPNYIFQSIYPHRTEIQFSPRSTHGVLKTGKPVVRRFVFDADAISSLKSKARTGSRVDVVTALIWKAFMAASLANNIPQTIALHAVNLRRRAHPPFPSDCFGNFLYFAMATSDQNKSNSLGELVGKLRDGFDNLRRPDLNLSVLVEDLEEIRKLLEHADMLGFTSWCSLGFHSADFGWGKPIWIAKCDIENFPESRFANGVWMMDTSMGDGIEAWVVLDEKYMTLLQNDEDLKALASIDPTPLK